MSTPLAPSHEALTVPEVMVALRLSRSMVYNLIRSRQLQSIKVGRARRIPAHALQDFMQANLEEAA
ncbi:helix-turn-helix domain-containing protein [Streptomyces roseoverticillatus]|uniref:helix-turn-helix domain-containing protein n=1 Tax=Streptomyces roseoverticillatus TaxID=66429 RepID=UPI001F42955B|nr:helix-turn-helix domain-containing protein [Streptomyces roseoverticillatus]MCF3104520.1 helix-turn-helix domain-containing protein [Streptomyces roseoverticillatus]